MTGRTIALRYVAFAGIAIAANLGVQAVTLALYMGEYSGPIAMLVGTAIGLVVKYLLDKRWIFFARPAGVTKDFGQFFLYSLTGAATTLIFWGIETGFARLSPGGSLRLAGGFVGLTIGYAVKYRLDLHYVFPTRPVR
jgi:putative flippase GtrA